MPQIQNAMEVFKLLEKSNCRQCEESTCLAFAASVFKGARQMSECPRLDPEIVSLYSDGAEKPRTLEQDGEEAMRQMQGQIAQVDLAEAAERLGGRYANGKLTLRILGKEFSVDQQGQFTTDIHIHGWIAGPVLAYILAGEGKTPSGNWVPLRELDGGKDWNLFFNQRCEKPLKAVADTYTDLFEDMVHLFNGKRVGQHFDADIALVLHPLPKLPLLVCYWKPDEGMPSDLHLFFDDTAEANLAIEAIYTLGAGLSLMFERIAQRHG
jgi:Domain of unknown function (DUF3786)/Putative Fe-S cluster